jgi:two-component system cell cycle sensor histidine kinase/response regulator CckA
MADGARILFVDDDRNIVDVAIGMLERGGYAVQGCLGGGAAIAALAQNADRYDLLITDATMPGVDGHEVVARWHETQPGRPVVVVTGHARDDVPALIGSDGATVVTKPFEADELLAVVRDVLARTGPGARG